MKGKSLLKIWIVIVMFTLISFSDCSFAANDTNSELLNKGSMLLELAISMLSWLWVFFANWAWEFLTNKWVYGEVLWLDTVLWKYRNIVKNFANFWLWFYFVYTVFKWLIDQVDGELITKKLKDIILWLLIAGVWIQASRFLTAVVVDISTITIVAAGSLPSQLVSESPEIEESVLVSLKNYLDGASEVTGWKEKDFEDFTSWLKFSLFPKNKWAANFITIERDISLDKAITKEDMFDTLMPNEENVSWPLYYLWFSILKTTTLISPNSASKGWIMATIFNALLQWWTTIVYSIEMFVLFVFSVMRVIYIWIFIVLSPMVILLRCIGQISNKKGESKLVEPLTKHFNFSSFFWNAFKPAIIILWFSLTLIFVSLIHKVISSKWYEELDIGGIKTKVYEEKKEATNTDWDKKYITEMDGDLATISFTNLWQTLANFILCVITVVLVYIVIKIAVTMWWWKDFVSAQIWKLQKNVGEDLLSLPVMPVAWYDEKTWEAKTHYLSAGKVFWLWNRNNSIIGSTVAHYQGKVNDEFNKQNAIIDSWFSNNTWYLSGDQVRTIENSMTNKSKAVWERLESTKAMIDEIKQGDKEWIWFGMTLSRTTAKNDGFWLNQFGARLGAMEGQPVTGTNSEAWRKMISDWNSPEIKEKDIEEKLEKIFKDHGDRVKAYAEFFGLGSDIDTWEELKNADISKK